MDHGTIVGKGYNNHNRSHTMHLPKTGCLINRNSTHTKATPITAEQYIWDQLDKHTKTDPLRDFLKQHESHAQYSKTNTYNEQLENGSNENITRNMQQESTQQDSRNTQSQRNQKNNISNRPTHRERKG